MARKSRKNGFDTSMPQRYADQLEAAAGTDALRRAAQAGMAAAKVEINRQLTAAVQASNLPAGGKYSTGDTLESIDKTMTAAWSGNIATMPLGFDMSKSGLASIMLMYGTPKMAPAPGLHEALYGTASMRRARKEQEAAILKVLERVGG